ncbi:hypothetical protein ACE0DR_00505 [Azotobacter sp. CWF10]
MKKANESVKNRFVVSLHIDKDNEHLDLAKSYKRNEVIHHAKTQNPGTRPGLRKGSPFLGDADLPGERLDIHMVIEHFAGSHFNQIQASQLLVPVAVGLAALDLPFPFRSQKMIDLGQQCQVYPCRAHACPQ